MVIARTWAMTFNRLVDRHFDAVNPRTAQRPSVTGTVSAGFMRTTLAICFLLFLLATAGFGILLGNFWPLMLAVPVLAWLATYSLTKRFTALCHFWLGASLGLAPRGGLAGNRAAGAVAGGRARADGLAPRRGRDILGRGILTSSTRCRMRSLIANPGCIRFQRHWAGPRRC